MSRSKRFVLKSDEPAILLGEDAAANPAEHLLHALAACLTTSMVYHAAARGIQIEEIESSLEGDIDLHGFLGLDPKVRKGYQGIRVNFKIKADVPVDQLQDVCRLGSGFSPVFDSVTNGVPVSVTAEPMQPAFPEGEGTCSWPLTITRQGRSQFPGNGSVRLRLVFLGILGAGLSVLRGCALLIYRIENS